MYIFIIYIHIYIHTYLYPVLNKHMYAYGYIGDCFIFFQIAIYITSSSNMNSDTAIYWFSVTYQHIIMVHIM
jgi:hypothetical protein